MDVLADFDDPVLSLGDDVINAPLALFPSLLRLWTPLAPASSFPGCCSAHASQQDTGSCCA